MPKKYLRTCSSLVIREMQTKALGFHLNLVRMAMINKTTDSKVVVQVLGKGDLSCTVAESINMVQPFWKSVWRILKNLRVNLLYGQLCTPWPLPEALRVLPHRHLLSDVYCCPTHNCQ